MEIEIHPEWLLTMNDGQAMSLPPLLRLLTEIRERGSISAAAAGIGLSYRHAWGMLREFETQFGAPLVQKSRGQGSVLSPLAEKLIWADKRIGARLSPMLDSVASELKRELEALLAGSRSALRITASHGFAVDALIKELAAHKVAVDLSYRSSTEAVAALARGECDLAGFHLPVGEFEPAAAAQYMKWLDPGQHSLVYLAHRALGLFVAKGNPKGIHGLADLRRKGVRFVNRQSGSGTRVLLELLLKKQKIRMTDIPGYENAEFTHAAVAAYVASGMADVSFGVETAARRFDLDFIPVIRERYFFACNTKDLGLAMMDAALNVMKGAKYRAIVNALPGYDGAQSGVLMPLDEVCSRPAKRKSPAG